MSLGITFSTTPPVKVTDRQMIIHAWLPRGTGGDKSLPTEPTVTIWNNTSTTGSGRSIEECMTLTQCRQMLLDMGYQADAVRLQAELEDIWERQGTSVTIYASFTSVAEPTSMKPVPPMKEMMEALEGWGVSERITHGDSGCQLMELD